MMKTPVPFRKTQVLAFGLFLWGTLAAAHADGPFFDEDFQPLSPGHAFTADANLQIVFGTPTICQDQGGTGTVPSPMVFSQNQAFLNLNGAAVATKNTFSGSYDLTFHLSGMPAAPSNPFGGSNAVLLQVGLRQSTPQSLDGLSIRFNSAGSVSVWQGAVTGSPAFNAAIGLGTTGPLLLRVHHDPGEVDFYVNGVQRAHYATTYGAGQSGYISFGRTGTTDYCSTKIAGVSVAQVALPDVPQVWAHYLYYGEPIYAQQPSGASYNALYPLDLVSGSSVVYAGTSVGQRIAQSGITGINVLLLDTAIGNELSQWGTFAMGDAAGIRIAPCLQVTTTANALRIVNNYVQSAASHASAAKMGNQWVVFVYHPNALTPTQWDSVKTQLATQTPPVSLYLIGQSPFSLSQYGGVNASVVTPYFSPLFDAQFVFDDQTDDYEYDIMNLYNGETQLAAGGIMPGYDRESSMTGGYDDSEGTARYRRDWQRVLDSGMNTNTLLTWNDLVEKHGLTPSSDWNWTRADLSAWYSAQLGATALPSRLANAANLYVTSPQRIRLGDTPDSEAMVINETSGSVKVTAQLFSTAGAWGAVAITTIPPHSVGAATTATGPVTSLPSNPFLRCYATVSDSAGNILQTVYSAPILLTGTSSVVPRIYNGTETRKLYYSIPAYKALSQTTPGVVGITLAGNPLQSGASATVTPPAGIAPRFVEVLQNTYQVQNFFNAAPYSCPVPLLNNKNVQSQMVTTEPWGFYVARVIDSNEKVGYSDPVCVPAPTNLILNSGFEANQAPTPYPASWQTTDATAFTTAGDYSIEGNYTGRHGKNAAYDVTTYQDVTLPAGTYVASAWVRSDGVGGGTTPIAQMQIIANGNTTSLPIPVTATASTPVNSSLWQQVTSPAIVMTAGTCRIAFHTQGAANQKTYFDNVWLYRVQ